MTLLEIIETVAQKIADSESYLNELDAVMGDGEHGSNMKKCFGAVREMLPSWKGQSDIQILKNTGMKLLTAGGGTATTLLGFFVQRLANGAQGKGRLDVKQIADILQTALASVVQKSQAQEGDKTMMDALIPGVCAFAEAAEQECSLKLAMEAAARAAEEGAKATSQMVARRGRGLYVGERGLGTPDPGAVSCAIIFATVCSCLEVEK